MLIPFKTDAQLDARYARLGAANTFTTGPQVFVGGATVRQSGGVAGTDEGWLTHDGTNFEIDNRDQTGSVRIFSGTALKLCTGTVDITGSYASNNVPLVRLASTRITLQSVADVGWSPTTQANTAPDVILRRPAAGVVAISDNAQNTAVGMRLQRRSSTTSNRDVAHIEADWTDGTDATRTGRLTLGVYEVGTLRTALTITAVTGGCTLTAGGPLTVTQGSVSAVGLAINSGSTGLYWGTVTGLTTSDSGIAWSRAGSQQWGINSVNEVTFGTAFGWKLLVGNLTASTASDGTDVTRLVGQARASNLSTPATTAEVRLGWADWTFASRTGRASLWAYSVTTAQEGVRVDGNAAGVRLGFYGQTAVARQTLPGAGVVNADDIRTALINLGLCA